MSNVKEIREAVKGLNNVIHSDDRYKYSIKDVKTGGYISYNGEKYMVKSLYLNLDVKWKSFKRKSKDYFATELELFSLETGDTLYVEWEFDDELEIFVTKDKSKLKDLSSNGQRVTREDIEYFAEEEEGKVEYDGKTYYYNDDETWAALYLKDKEDKDGLKVRFYEFISDDDEGLTVEVWYDDVDDERPDSLVYTSMKVSPDEIEILQLEAGE